MMPSELRPVGRAPDLAGPEQARAKELAILLRRVQTGQPGQRLVERRAMHHRGRIHVREVELKEHQTGSKASLREKGCRPTTRSRGHPSNSPP